MTEKTTSPRMGRFNIVRQFMLLQRYGQNHPWTYMGRVTVAVTLYGAVLIGICAVPLFLFGNTTLAEAWPWLLVLFGSLVLGGAFGAGVGLFMLKWTTKDGAVPRDADPDTLRAAQRHLRKGVLSGDPETDRLARHLVPQARRGNSTKLLVVLFVVAAGPFLVLQVLRHIGGDGDPLALVLGAFMVVAFAIAWPFARKRKRNSARFAEAHDAEYGPPEHGNGPPAPEDGRPAQG
ncbi:hypothetical protein IDM40_18340 [Nocardiopsis sp. HNM0947]|uniref:Uncharacterized protein n=1 Tax=Nocardiopsis coralli TaxID=2772213 RepID=A0ABR9P9X9_9ACTN|nr:hypothetical protein [Nocardiopsis coralli]MBE3000645.1 hypothetical protein [Nocardiopsis coralli]